MPRFLLTIQYDGTDFCGWQRQKELRTVQKCLEEALSALFEKPTQAVASGRTDAGVHAAAQAVHFDADTKIPADKIAFALNTALPPDLSALACKIVPDNFNARFFAKRKTYCYKLYYSPHRKPLLERGHAHTVIAPDLDKMREAADKIIGTRDFSCFLAAGSKVKDAVRTVFSLDVRQKPTDNGEIFEIYVCGNGFLYNMVRIIAGTLLYAGIGKISPQEVSEIIENRDRKRAGKTLPPNGLTLVGVEY